MKKNETAVVFRVHKGTGKVFAVIPVDHLSHDTCFVYQRVSRIEPHDDKYQRVIASSKPASECEAQALLKDLHAIGFKGLVVRQKMNCRKKNTVAV